MDVFSFCLFGLILCLLVCLLACLFVCLPICLLIFFFNISNFILLQELKEIQQKLDELKVKNFGELKSQFGWNHNFGVQAMRMPAFTSMTTICSLDGPWGYYHPNSDEGVPWGPWPYPRPTFSIFHTLSQTKANNCIPLLTLTLNGIYISVSTVARTKTYPIPD